MLRDPTDDETRRVAGVEDPDPVPAAALRRSARWCVRGRKVAADKGQLFAAAIPLLDPYARQVLQEMNTHLLLGTGDVTATGVQRHGDDTDAGWTLSWPQQRALDIDPVAIRAWYGAQLHHPHSRGATMGDWPLNVFTPDQAQAAVQTASVTPHQATISQRAGTTAAEDGTRAGTAMGEVAGTATAGAAGTAEVMAGDAPKIEADLGEVGRQ